MKEALSIDSSRVTQVICASSFFSLSPLPFLHTGLHATRALNTRPSLLRAITALLRFRRDVQRLERLHLLMHLDPVLLPDDDDDDDHDDHEEEEDDEHHALEEEDEGTLGDMDGTEGGVPMRRTSGGPAAAAAALKHPRLRALRRWLTHLVAKLPLRFHGVGAAVMGTSAYCRQLLGLPFVTSSSAPSTTTDAAGGYVRLVARFLAQYGPTTAVCVGIVMRGAAATVDNNTRTGAAAYTLPPVAAAGRKGLREDSGNSSSSSSGEYAPVFCMTAAEALTRSRPTTTPTVSSSTLDASAHSVRSATQNYHLHRCQPPSISGGSFRVDAESVVSQQQLPGVGGPPQQQRGGGEQPPLQPQGFGGGSVSNVGGASTAMLGGLPPYWDDFWGNGIAPALQGLPEGGDRYLLLPLGPGGEEEEGTEEAAGEDGKDEEAGVGGGGTGRESSGGGLRALLFGRRISLLSSEEERGSFWARAKSPGRPRSSGSGGSRTPDRRSLAPQRRKTILPLPALPEEEAAAAQGTYVHQSGARWRAGSAHVAQPQFAYYVAPVSGSEALVVLFADRSLPATDSQVVAFVRAMLAVLSDRGVFANAEAAGTWLATLRRRERAGIGSNGDALRLRTYGNL